MGRVAATRVCQFLWLLLGLNLVIEGRMLPSGGANVIEPCKYTWQLPGTDCWPPIGQSPRCDHLNSEGCAGSPPTVDKAEAGDHVEAISYHGTELDDPDCRPVPGRLPPIRCQNPPIMAAEAASIQTAKVLEPCKYTWQLPGTTCWPPIGQSPRCDHLHSEGRAGSPPTVADVNQDKTAAGANHQEVLSHHEWTEFQDPECVPIPGRRPPIQCQDPPVMLAHPVLPAGA